MRSDSSARAVSMMIGIAAVASFDRAMRQISRPSTCGSIRSSISRSGGRAAMAASASRPFATVSVGKAGLVEIVHDQLRDVRIVFDDEHACHGDILVVAVASSAVELTGLPNRANLQPPDNHPMAFLVLLLAQLLSAPPTPHLKMTTSASAAEARRGCDDQAVRRRDAGSEGARLRARREGLHSDCAGDHAARRHHGRQAGVPEIAGLVLRAAQGTRARVTTCRFVSSRRLRSAAPLKAGDRVTVAGVLNYQACDDAVCFNPVSAPVSWSVTVK